MALKHWVMASAVLAGMSVALQIIAFIIPGWLLIETTNVSFNMALWYVIVCEVNTNVTDDFCGPLSYKRLFDERSHSTVSHLQLDYSSIISTQLQVTASLLLTVAAFLLVLYQLKSFQSQTPDQPSIYDNDPPNKCNLRFRFIYSGGFAGIFQVIAGPLLFTDIYQLAVLYYKLEKPRPGVPFALIILGLGGICAALSAICEFLIVFRIEENPRRRQYADTREHGDQPSQYTIPLHSPARNLLPVDICELSGCNSCDYYGQDYNAQNPTFRTQGVHHHSTSQDLFPGYKLGRHNLQGRDQKWWRKVTFASMGFR